jgi:phosphoribosylamine--glycine ligase
MGAYAPVPESIIDPWQYGQVEDIAAKSLEGMRAKGVPYEKAVLYIGGMASHELSGELVVIEYNVRFGDPETQVIMPLLQAVDVDAYRLLRSAAEGTLEVPNVDFRNLKVAALTVCLASAGYPQGKSIGDRIWGLENQYNGVTVQQAAVKDGATNGGRVLYVSATGKNIDEAARLAYDSIDVDRIGPDSGRIGFNGMQLRRDIGDQAKTAA